MLKRLANGKLIYRDADSGNEGVIDGDFEFPEKSVFMVSLDLQRKQAGELCFGICGKATDTATRIRFGDDKPLEFLNCFEKECPFLDSELLEPNFIRDDVIYYIRRLKEAGIE